LGAARSGSVGEAQAGLPRHRRAAHLLARPLGRRGERRLLLVGVRGRRAALAGGRPRHTTFVEAFYDGRFNNRLYAGRRRLMTQYVDQFPVPDPESACGRRIMELSRRRFEAEEGEGSAAIEEEIDRLTWEAFGTKS